ncbi:MAG: murein L,D-transpeptidase catalytic domain-containing protein, partial [Polyangiales bacterium]
MTRWNIALALAMSLVGCTDDLEYGSETSDLDIDAFVVSDLPAAERAVIVGRYDRLDPTDKIPRGLLEDAIVFYDMNLALIPKQKYFVVTDMSLHSGKDRYWLVDVTTGAVEAHKVAHGDGSDPDNNGTATTFGNVDGSHKTSLGFYLTGEIYDGTHVHSMRLDGLSKDGSVNGMANTNARPRLIVMHEATYVDETNT